MTWSVDLRKRLKLDFSLSRYNTFKIGGEAKFFLEPKDTKELILAIKEANEHKISYYIIGNGSNILINDKGIDGLVIRLSSNYFRQIKFKNNEVIVGAGIGLSEFIHKAKLRGLGGCEFLVGIPATLGGAIVMNAGDNKNSIGDLIRELKVIDRDAKLKILCRDEIKFGYRTSNLSKYIILSARLRLTRRPKKEINSLIKDRLAHKLATQDLSHSSLGCIFKNPDGKSAGELIDLCGLKGKRVGDAEISQIHANFIINRGSARAKDVLALMDIVRNKVKKRFGITLEPEIKIW